MQPGQQDLLPQLWGWISPHLMALLTPAAIIACTKYLAKMMTPMVRWAREHIAEHDLMWEEYCRTHEEYDWRIPRPLGRGITTPER
ncbi:MAG TPA: hypothetical protein VN517_03735 [Terriglobales bacterium]|nr:hypothetical protein [Terriglobales bacterium]